MEEGRGGAWWRYRVCYRGGVQLRSQPCVDGAVLREMLEFGQEFVSRSSICLEGIVYVRLDNGWVFERRGDLQVLELLESHEDEDVFIDDASPIEKMRSALEKANGFEDVVRASRTARPKSDGVVRRIARVAEAASSGEVDLSHVGEVVWAASTLERRSQLRLLGVLAKQTAATPPNDAERAAQIFSRLDKQSFYAIVDELDDAGDFRDVAAEVVRAFFVARIRRPKEKCQQQHPSSSVVGFFPFSSWFNRGKTSLFGTEDSLCAAAKRSLRDPDLQYAWAF